MNARTTVLRQVALPLSGLLLSLIDTGDGAVWELSPPQRPHALLHIAASGPNLLNAGYTTPGRWDDTGLAIGHVPAHHHPPDAVRFTTVHLRWRREANTAPILASSTLWVAEATGNYDLVVLPGDGDKPQHVVRLMPLA